MTEQESADTLEQAIAEAGKYHTCMALTVHEVGDAVELLLDTAIVTYSEWIKGEGADICLYRCRETNKVVGVRLPLMNRRLVVHHDGPLRINEGFLEHEPLHSDAQLDALAEAVRRV